MLSHKSHKRWIKKKLIWIERKKENIFLWKKRKLFSCNQNKKKKKKTNKQTFFLEEQTFIIYRYFFLEEREGVYFKLKYLLPYLQFFFLTLCKNIFGKSVWTIIIKKKKRKKESRVKWKILLLNMLLLFIYLFMGIMLFCLFTRSNII